jgi:hypothetical protein
MPLGRRQYPPTAIPSSRIELAWATVVAVGGAVGDTIGSILGYGATSGHRMVIGVLK